jgi:hypothetical protein
MLLQRKPTIYAVNALLPAADVTHFYTAALVRCQVLGRYKLPKYYITNR